MNNLRTELLDLNKNTQEQLRTIGRELFSLREKMRSSQEVSTTSSIDSLEIDHRNDIPPSYAAACQEKGAFVVCHPKICYSYIRTELRLEEPCSRGFSSNQLGEANFIQQRFSTF